MRVCECAATHSRCRARGERTVSNSQRFLSSFRRPVTLCVIPRLRSTVVLMCSVHGSPLPLSVSLASRAPSLLSCPLLSPSLPPATFVPLNVVNDCRSSFFFPLSHATLLLTSARSLSLSVPLHPLSLPQRLSLSVLLLTVISLFPPKPQAED